MKKRKIKANDYIATTRNYLKQFMLYNQYIENVDEALEDIGNRLSGGEIRATAYDKGSKGSCYDTDGVSRMAFKRMDLDEERERLKEESEPIRKHLNRLRNSLDRLPEHERRMLLDYYANKKTYAELIEKYYCSERTCRETLRTAERKLAIMLFGMAAAEPVLFLETKKEPSH